MNWHHLSTNPQVIEDLYGETPPPLQGCWLYLLVLEEECGGSLTLGLSTKQMPEAHRWPREWSSESNRVRLGLTLAGLSAVHVEGWTADNVVEDVDISRADDGRSVALRLSGTWGHLIARSDSMTIRVHALKVVIEDPLEPYDH